MGRNLAKRAALLLSAGMLAACPWPAPEPPENAPGLILLVVVDQLGADHLVRLNDAFEGGIRRLLDEGVVFGEAHHAHAGTSTAPGHASIVTGCHPSSHGVISNYWFDRATGLEVYSAEDERNRRSPARLECSSFGDWLKATYRPSRVYSMSAKDRSAILMGGHRADGAYWYDWDGTFTSSDYYHEDNPRWLEQANAEGFLASTYGRLWEPLAFDPEVLAGMGVDQYDLGPLEEDFPHPIGGLSPVPGEFFFGELFDSPWLDEYLLRLARGVIEAESLGRDSYPDLLALGFSTTDSVGHGHGPWSREFFDILVRLDRELGSFFDWLDQSIGMDRVAVVLTSDHGSVPIPEKRAEGGLPGSRVGFEEIRCFQAVDAALDTEFGAGDWFRPGLFFSPLPEGSQVSLDEVKERARALLEVCPSVSKVWLAEELSSEGDDPMQRRFARSYFAARSPDLLVEWEPYFLATASSASSHGTPHRYDTHVPLVLMWPGGEPGRNSYPVSTVDIAPTLAEWTGVTPPTEIDGRSLSGAMVAPSAEAPSDASVP
ncbi:MAG: alkaline phosphatase family protein [Thermoanaerobaculia bacterium]